MSHGGPETSPEAARSVSGKRTESGHLGNDPLRPRVNGGREARIPDGSVDGTRLT